MKKEREKEGEKMIWEDKGGKWFSRLKKASVILWVIPGPGNGLLFEWLIAWPSKDTVPLLLVLLICR